MTEQDEQESGTLLRALHCERDDQHVIWGLTVYRDEEARNNHRRYIPPIHEKMDGLWEQWPHPIYCVPLAAKVGGDLRNAWDTRIDDGPIIIVTRGVATHGRREELIPLLRALIKQDEQQSGKVLHTLEFERDDPSVIWGLTVYRDKAEQNIHSVIAAPTLSTRDGLWEQWPHPIYCDPITLKIGDGLGDIYRARS
jgi:quinol monooxygenase YgiN